MRILIVLPGGIGNAVMFTPAFATLINSFGNSEFYMMTSELGANLVFEPSLKIKKFFYYNHNSKLSFIKSLMEILLFYKFDIFISSMGINPLKSGILSIFSKSGIRCGEDSFLFNRKIKSDSELHEVERNLNIVKQICPENKIEKSLRFYFTEQDRIFADKILEEHKIDKTRHKIIGAHIGSNDFLAAKRWSIDNFKKIFLKLAEKYPELKIILFGGKNEIEYTSRISGDYIINLTGKTTLQTAGLIIKKCSAFVSNDSGLMHIAASVDIPVIALFGPTIISKNKPYSSKSHVIFSDVECRPCYKYNRKIQCLKNFKCMSEISVDRVFEVLEKII
ncbi:glycosyltransferase family 9 protein [Candidatus Dependentiae bacterium]|nr:glycosyltransferase family 9 protein [Candidatus Dependentiae bacterium]